MTTAEPTCLETAQLAFEPGPREGVERKALESPLLPDHQVAILRLTPGASLDVSPESDRELYILEGDLSLPGGNLAAGGYVRLPGSQPFENRSTSGCTLFYREGPFFEGECEPALHQTGPSDWRPGQGNLRVLPLHNGSTSGTALVHWPAGERFVPHRHFGGEEIFVLSGTFEDEHGRYPAGTWLLSPHLSTHHPFVREETVILVKTGHVPIA